MNVRLLTPADVGPALLLCRKAGWNQTEEDWRRVLRLQPDGCFGIDCDGGLVATATVTCFGARLAWIGMVLTDPEYRGRGFARRLMEHAVELLERRGIAWIKLDATDLGRPLYRKLGFEDEAPIERWQGSGTGVSAPGLPPLRLDAALDLPAFGADRTALLGDLASLGGASIPGAGFIMTRPGASAAYLGPCVAASPETARELVRWVMARYPEQGIYWDLLPDNPEAVRLAGEFGFRTVRRLVRMIRPGRNSAAPLARDDSRVFAIAGFEFG